MFELIPGTDIWCFVNSNNPQEGLRNYGGSQALLLQKKPTMMADHSEVQTIEHDKPETALAESLALDNVIRRHVQQVLELNHGNKLRTARTLRVSRSTLYRLLNRHNRENATLGIIKIIRAAKYKGRSRRPPHEIVKRVMDQSTSTLRPAVSSVFRKQAT